MIAERKYNFSPGPSQLPDDVLLSVQEELLNHQGSGSSVMEYSHRGAEFSEIAATTEANLREVLNIDDNYTVMFLQGGASAQFAMLPYNFLKTNADYLVTGQWSKKAYKEANRISQVNLALDTIESNYTKIPSITSWELSEHADYLHLASNETIGGVQFKKFPNLDAPLCCDMSSDILSRPIDVNKFSLIYAGAQKNLGPAGVTLVIIKNEFLEQARTDGASYFLYQTHAAAGSMHNTPPCFNWYVLGEVLKWVNKTGLDSIYHNNTTKAQMLYDYIDSTEFYSNPVDKSCRSDMNIPFTLKDDSLDKDFLAQSNDTGLLNLKGHRSVGGMRASIYNAMPIEGVQTLIDFMKDFEKRNG